MEIALPYKLAFLRTRLDTGVEVIETHMSWVFLTPERVYKLKKPVILPFLDQSTLERRERSCRKELMLGRRLARDVYEDVVPLVMSARGLALGGEGEVVDWLVVMRRLPAAAMLPEALRTSAATEEDAHALGELLAAFYAHAQRTTWSSRGYIAHMRDQIVRYASELVTCDAPRAQVEAIEVALLDLVHRQRTQLEHRVGHGRVVDAHGDLRPEHVCLESPPVVIDPLEFDDDLRTLDVASELAFFTLECARLGHRWFGERVTARCTAQLGDDAGQPLVALYTGQHALARALIALRHVADAPAAERDKWRARADEYLAYALRSREPREPR